MKSKDVPRSSKSLLFQQFLIKRTNKFLKVLRSNTFKNLLVRVK
ncbi:hypothetical protein APA_4175 [Pseudanabaena sp. lw0831]|nr:hypothetical protein APA_4175 [Pseudanabaena sp. lw0831]